WGTHTSTYKDNGNGGVDHLTNGVKDYSVSGTVNGQDRSSVENWYDSATYCFFIKYDKRERWISIDTQFEEKYQPFKILIQMVEKVSNHF
ncbi:MAG: hypothetical protein IKB95_09505, partial [Bacteroidales bacterium]|nr:hypothetical protein [Bacteroidales bacterium]